MKNIYGVVIALLLGVAAGGYWLGKQDTGHGIKDTVRSGERKPLYFRNPMGLPDTSPVPKKDAMGMDYVPVYEGEAEQGGQGVVSLSVEKVQKLGVKSEAAGLRMLDRTLRVAGRIEIDERRSYTVAPKFEGWVERLYVNTTGQDIKKGQPLFDVYSPELVSAQREHALAVQGMAAMKDADSEARESMRQLAEASAARLRNWDISGTDEARMSAGNDRRTVTFHAPVSGIVLEKKALQGMRFMPGEMFYRIADLSTVWVLAEVAEQDIGSIKAGDGAQASLAAYPAQHFDGKVDFIYPTMNAATRTVQVRIELANPQGLLKPAMFATVMLAAGMRDKVLSVPVSAVIDSGTRQIVLVQLAQGRFEPRGVRLGSRSDDYVEVLEGVAEGEQVVTSANFLIDAESNLKAALSGLGTTNTSQPPQLIPTSPTPPSLPFSGEERGRNGGGTETPAQQNTTVGHKAQGVLKAVNEDGSVNITHEPIASLKWPGMTMDFKLANPSLAANYKPGSTVAFEIVERGEGEWVITKMQPVAAGHKGH